MQAKKSPFDKLRPILLAVIVGILSIFLLAEIILLGFLGYIWYVNPENVKTDYLEEGIIGLIILTILTYFLRMNFTGLNNKSNF